MKRDEQAIRIWRSALTEPTLITLPNRKAAVSLRHRLHKARAAERRLVRATHGKATELDIDQLVVRLEELEASWQLQIAKDVSLGFNATRPDGRPVDLFESKDPYAEVEDTLGPLDPTKPLFGG